jgi:hypothetical protein
VATDGELTLFFSAAGQWLLYSAIIWLLYIALEPFVRRRWPAVLVGWSRLLAGNYRDPLIGRDMLVGCLLAVLGVFAIYLGYPLASLFNAPQIRPSTPYEAETYTLFLGAPAVIAKIFGFVSDGILLFLAFSFILFLVRALLRNTWAAIAAVALVFSAIFATQVSSLIFSTSIVVVIGIWIFAYFRFGLLAMAASYLFAGLLDQFPIPTPLSAWYSGIGLTGLVIMLLFALYAFHTSLGSQPIFGRASLED